MDNTFSTNQPVPTENEATSVTKKIKRPKLIALVSSVSILLIIVAVLFVKGFLEI